MKWLNPKPMNQFDLDVQAIKKEHPFLWWKARTKVWWSLRLRMWYYRWRPDRGVD